MKTKEFFMKRCLELALKGKGYVSPNPMVGCVIVHNNKIISEGFHEKYKGNHAEVNAIEKIKEKKILSKSVLYVNLEPCSHFGNTPPCVNTIIKYNIPEVVIGALDVDPIVKQESSVDKLINNNINVTVGVLEKECKELNKRFYIFHEKKRPYVLLKWAQSKDGFIAPLFQKEAFWMTSKKSKELVHQYRGEEDAILIGRITAEKDNPLLTCREIKNYDNPTRIIIDRNLKLKNNLKIFNNDASTIIINSIKNKKSKHINYTRLDFNNLINNLMDYLYSINIQSVIIEGGAITLSSFIKNNIWDEARVFNTNKILRDGIKSPRIDSKLFKEIKVGEDTLKIFFK